MSGKKKSDIKMIKAIYRGSAGMSTVYGASRVLGNPISYGYHKDGDVFDVAVDDIIARPSSFNAWPCNRPFIIRDEKVKTPCTRMEPKDSAESHPEPTLETIIGLPGVGKKTAKTLEGLGVTTKDELLFADYKVLDKLSPASRKGIEKWQKRERAAKLNA